MLKEFFWDAFERFGSIEAYTFYKELDENDKAKSEINAIKEEVAVSS